MIREYNLTELYIVLAKNFLNGMFPAGNICNDD